MVNLDTVFEHSLCSNFFFNAINVLLWNYVSIQLHFPSFCLLLSVLKINDYTFLSVCLCLEKSQIILRVYIKNKYQVVNGIIGIFDFMLGTI